MKMVQFQNARYKVLPMLKMTDDDVERYMDANDLPRHPLQLKGYHTVEIGTPVGLLKKVKILAIRALGANSKNAAFT